MTQTMVDVCREWLGSVGLLDVDPDAMLLLDCAAELDWLNDPARTLTEKDLLAARHRSRAAMVTIRKSLEATLDKHTSVRAQGRHALAFGKLAAETLGWVDLGLLDEDLAGQVLTQLEAQGIRPEAYQATLLSL